MTMIPPSRTQPWPPKPPGAGAPRVVDVKLELTPPTVTVVVTLVRLLAALVCCAWTWSPLMTVPGELVGAPPLMMYMPPAAEMGDGALMPVIVTGALVIVVLTGTPERLANVN